MQLKLNLKHGRRVKSGFKFNLFQNVMVQTFSAKGKKIRISKPVGIVEKLVNSLVVVAVDCVGVVGSWRPHCQAQRTEPSCDNCVAGTAVWRCEQAPRHHTDDTDTCSVRWWWWRARLVGSNQPAPVSHRSPRYYPSLHLTPFIFFVSFCFFLSFDTCLSNFILLIFFFKFGVWVQWWSNHKYIYYQRK